MEFSLSRPGVAVPTRELSSTLTSLTQELGNAERPLDGLGQAGRFLITPILHPIFSMTILPRLCRGALLASLSFWSIGLSAQSVARAVSNKDLAFPDWIYFKPGVEAAELLPVLHHELHWPAACSLAEKGRSIPDKDGYSHQRFQQLFHGVPVFGATLAVHSQGGELRSVNGDLLETAPQAQAQSATVDADAALEAAKRYVGAVSYMWESAQMEAFIKRERNDPAATFRPAPQLMYYPMAFPKLRGELRLAYVLDVYAMQPRSRHYVVVDARNGAVLNTFERLHAIDEPGSANTAYSGIQPIITYRPTASGPYQLRDLSRGGGIITYDCGNTDDYASATVPSNASNNWNLGNLYANSILDAHWGTEETYDYYFNGHNWNSYDNNGSPMLSYVHFNLVDYGYPNNNNAFWDGERMTYGDGDGTTFNPLTAIDVLGHEITHGVTENSAGLEYQDESGALNESFSDIIGSCIEHQAKPSGFSWQLGNDMSVSGTGFRNMADPNQNGDPDTYQGTYWYTGSADNGGVHTNSGVQNFWFYLLSEGGTGTNDLGDAYNVQGIGISAAGDIVFKSLTTYLNANSNYADARSGSIQAATDLFGACSPELAAVTNAWYAVGVGTPFNSAVVAAFAPSAFYSCTAPAVIQFTNGSLNASSFIWDFGDGTSSTNPSPQHTYAQTGSYTVSLIAQGSTVCNSSDTLTASLPIVVDNVGALPAPACTPVDPNPATNTGIYNFTLADIDQASTGAVDGYQDFSCGSSTDLTEGLAYPLSVALHVPGRVGFWIDMNNDGTFATNELLYASPTESLVHTANVIIPAGTVFNTRLRARVISSSQPIISGCSVSGGQAEDYAVRILDNSAPPQAGFTAAPITLLAGTSTSFHDLSLNAPTSWEWSFEGGSIGSSTLQNPQVSYATVGDYDVQLIVHNDFGSDTLLAPDFIHVVNAFNLCQVESTTASSGTFYDPGGANGDYSSNETCTLLIAPPCAMTISVSFQSFGTESGYDYLRFYDGSTGNAPLLGTFSGSTLPGSFTTTGGQLFVKWTSDQLVTGSGFEVHWNAQSGSSLPLTAVAAVDDTNPSLGQLVQFSDLSAEGPSSWFWDFGDGTSSTAQNPAHAFSSPGPKTVVLTATNCSGPDTDTLLIDVQQPGSIIIDPVSVQLDGSPCVDSLSTSITIHNAGGGNLNWAAISVFTDGFEGSGYNTSLWASSSGVNSMDCGAQEGSKAHRFSNNGVRSIRTLPVNIQPASRFSFYLRYGTGGNCEAVDEGEYVVLEYSLDGAAWTIIGTYADLATYSDWTLVQAAIPPAAISSHTSFRIRQVANSGSTYDVWAIDQATLTTSYTGNLSLDPTSGTNSAGDSMVLSVSVPVAGMSPGNYTDSLLISTNDPANPVITVPVAISLIDLPCAAFTVTLTDSCQGLVQFTNATTNDAGTWSWDFGDGTTSTEQSPAHTYATAGTYTVTMTAGTSPLSTQFTQVVQVDAMAVQSSHTDPDGNNGSVDFTATCSTGVQWSWDFGDGGTADQAIVSHTYALIGTYIVTVTVWNATGCHVTLTDTIHYGTSSVVELHEMGISVQPNPNQGIFTVHLQGLSGDARAWITDATGRSVPGAWTLRNGWNAIDISSLADGLYLLKVRTEDVLRQVRVVKQ